MCDMFGGHCFDKIITDEAEYKKCSAHCLEDCQEIGLTVWHSSYPLNLEDVCKKGRFLDQHLESTFSQQFAFDGYKTLVEGGSLPELVKSFANGSLCKEFVENFIAFVSIESTTTSVVNSKRESYTVSFNDQMGTIGGTLGLFTGMSLLSFVEIIFLIFMLVMGTVQELRERRDKSKVFGENSKTNAIKEETCSTQTRDNTEKIEDCNKEDILQVYVMF